MGVIYYQLVADTVIIIDTITASHHHHIHNNISVTLLGSGNWLGKFEYQVVCRYVAVASVCSALLLGENV